MTRRGFLKLLGLAAAGVPFVGLPPSNVQHAGPAPAPNDTLTVAELNQVTRTLNTPYANQSRVYWSWYAGSAIVDSKRAIELVSS